MRGIDNNGRISVKVAKHLNGVHHRVTLNFRGTFLTSPWIRDRAEAKQLAAEIKETIRSR